MRNLFTIFIFILFFNNSYALNIDETIKSTIESNSKVKIAVEKLKESKEVLIYSNNEKLPDIISSISGTYSNADTTTPTTSSTPETFTDAYKITITKNIYDFGFTDLEIERSKTIYNNELINFKSTIQDLILQSISGYLSVINYQKSLEATIKNYDSVLSAYEEIKTRFNLGSATLLDLQKAQAAFAIASSNLFAAEQNLLISKKSFKKIVGKEPISLEEVLNINTSINLMEIIDKSLNNNLKLLLISNNIKEKEILISKEKKSKKPALDFSGTGLYTYGSRLEKGTETTSGSISLTLTIPIFQKGQDDSNIRKYQSQLLQSELNLQDEKNDLQILISNKYKDFKISESRMKSNLLLINSIKTSLESIKEEYLIGTKTINDLAEEEENLLNANVNYFNLQKDFLLNYFEIKSLEGSLIDLFEKYLPKLN